MTPKQPQLTDEQAMQMFLEEARRSLPSKRSFEVLRQARDYPSDGGGSIFSIGGRFEPVIIEAHSYNTTDHGGLAFFEVTIQEKGAQGPGAYSRAIITLAPGTWLEVREITESMQLRPSSIS